MSIIKKLNTPFYLTGGTALSRHYFHHRYSDALDLFTNSDINFDSYINLIFQTFISEGPKNNFNIDHQKTRRLENFTQIFLSHADRDDINLKIDFVNDVAARFGALEEDLVLGKTDNWRNILSNKIAALFRFEPKDIADIWVICGNKRFSWIEIMTETKCKEIGMEPDIAFNILKSFPETQLNRIKWEKPVQTDKIKSDLNIIADDIFEGRQNSLAPGYLP